MAAGGGVLLHTTLTVDPQTSAGEFWREVAKLGGFLARRRDGEPGWQTLWRGWRDLDLMTCGARLALGGAPRCG
jgi:hypothetical protein